MFDYDFDQHNAIDCR